MVRDSRSASQPDVPCPAIEECPFGLELPHFIRDHPQAERYQPPADDKTICPRCHRPRGMHLHMKFESGTFPEHEDFEVRICAELLPQFGAAPKRLADSGEEGSGK